MTTLVTLTRFPRVFECLRESVDQHEPTIRKIVVTSGTEKIEAPGWEIIPGVEPFIFARNANIGINAAAGDDVLLINDDCVLFTPIADTLSEICKKYNCGIVSPQVVGGVGNLYQKFGFLESEFYVSKHRLAFVCVFLPASTISTVGLLDEQFDGYGGDDDDYCYRAKQAGLTLGCTSLVSVKHGFGERKWSASFGAVMGQKEKDRSMKLMLQKFKNKHRK